jgi:LPXTG-motif cell wall-anchored protein
MTLADLWRALPSGRMRGWRRSLAVAGAVLALLPAAAAAQSAGDEQYEDPFGGQPAQSKPHPAPAPATPAPAPATSAQTTAAPAAPSRRAAASTTPAQAGELPRTGGDARWPALLGLALLSAGVALRAHARRAP